jgi:2-polyprenyl-3-methyl-5-hydroxy-6-metoxy-1,4-benzoquinol methylase
MKRFCPGNWTGYDMSEKVIAQARALFPGIEFITEFMEGRKWDGVVCSEVIEHVEDDAAWVKKLWDITRSRLVVTTPAVNVKDPGHLRLYTAPMLEKLFSFIPGAKVENGGRFFYVTAERK